MQCGRQTPTLVLFCGWRIHFIGIYLYLGKTCDIVSQHANRRWSYVLVIQPKLLSLKKSNKAFSLKHLFLLSTLLCVLAELNYQEPYACLVSKLCLYSYILKHEDKRWAFFSDKNEPIQSVTKLERSPLGRLIRRWIEVVLRSDCVADDKSVTQSICTSVSESSDWGMFISNCPVFRQQKQENLAKPMALFGLQVCSWRLATGVLPIPSHSVWGLCSRCLFGLVQEVIWSTRVPHPSFLHVCWIWPAQKFLSRTGWRISWVSSFEAATLNLG